MKQIFSLRIEDYNFDLIRIISKQNNISINTLINLLIDNFLYEIKTNNSFIITKKENIYLTYKENQD